MRELKQNANIDNARKDPNFINGTWLQVLHAGHNEGETSEAKDLDLSKDVQTENTPDKSEVNP